MRKALPQVGNAMYEPDANDVVYVLGFGVPDKVDERGNRSIFIAPDNWLMVSGPDVKPDNGIGWRVDELPDNHPPVDCGRL